MSLKFCGQEEIAHPIHTSWIVIRYQVLSKPRLLPRELGDNIWILSEILKNWNSHDLWVKKLMNCKIAIQILPVQQWKQLLYLPQILQWQISVSPSTDKNYSHSDPHSIQLTMGSIIKNFFRSRSEYKKLGLNRMQKIGFQFSIWARI